MWKCPGAATGLSGFGPAKQLETPLIPEHTHCPSHPVILSGFHMTQPILPDGKWVSSVHQKKGQWAMASSQPLCNY